MVYSVAEMLNTILSVFASANLVADLGQKSNTWPPFGPNPLFTDPRFMDELLLELRFRRSSYVFHENCRALYRRQSAPFFCVAVGTVRTVRGRNT